MEPTDITWVICAGARQANAELEETLGPERHQEFREALKQFLCSYFAAVQTCDVKQGKSI
ncbi:MAG: hypothetical protein KDK91_32845 [Gammaproteobacteria bacterium]|nr:hypothetical protein [Gammaproteobacteria bacterium]MCB9872263.1 hypothetical protein [Planctomycetota bacterium]